MATGMGFFQKLFSPESARTELLEELAVIAGCNEGLVNRLKRHAALTTGNVRAGVEAVAEKQAAHIKVLHSILAEYNIWEKLPEEALHDGSNNWARLSGDLEVLGALAADLRKNSIKWESVDQRIADKLLQLAGEDEIHESELRKQASKCDALALD
jgi:hypothetical protein